MLPPPSRNEVTKMKYNLIGALAGILLASGTALAQDAPAPEAAPAGPGRPEVHAVDDWFVRCFPVQSPSPCDMFQEEEAPQTRQRVLSLSLSLIHISEPTRLLS